MEKFIKIKNFSSDVYVRLSEIKAVTYKSQFNASQNANFIEINFIITGLSVCERYNNKEDGEKRINDILELLENE